MAACFFIVLSMFLISVIVILLFDLGAVLTGMAGRVLFPGLEDPEGILPLISTSLLHPVLGGIMMVVVLAAIMSTVDSLLILASSAVVVAVVALSLQGGSTFATASRAARLVPAASRSCMKAC